MFPATHTIAEVDADLQAAIAAERARQESHIELIASENFASPAVMEAQGTVLTNKYAEGYPGKRYYGGCQYVDVVEDLARDRAKKLFGCGFANVQPHSGSQANQAVFNALLSPGDTILGMSIAHGGHLTHGAGVNLSGKIYNAVGYGLRGEDEHIDYDEVGQTGAAAQAETAHLRRFRLFAPSGLPQISRHCRFGGRGAAGGHRPLRRAGRRRAVPQPGRAQLVTTTTHKTLRGPRGGMVMGDAEFEKPIQSMVFPACRGVRSCM